MRVVTVLGARPQFIKAAAVSSALRDGGQVDEFLVHTGQHHESQMSDVFFTELGLPPPTRHLGIAGGSHGQMTGRMLESVERVLLELAPDRVLVYGDTNSTLAGALAAAKLRIPVSHVEAGLRSFNRRMPEEVNRVLTDHLAAQLFAPTKRAVANLRREGIAGPSVMRTGDVMFDCSLVYAGAAARSDVIARHGLTSKGFVLATVHRAETTDVPDRLAAVLAALEAVARHRPVVLPLHPRTRDLMAEGGIHVDRSGGASVRVIDPVGYLDMLALESQSEMVITDSGGVQKEAFFARVPCITIRSETEWVELVELGWNTLVDRPEEIVSAVEAVVAHPPRPTRAQPYGDGRSRFAIARALASVPDR